MQLYSPLSTTPKRKAVRAPALGSIDGLRIGILENGKLNAEEMLNCIDECNGSRVDVP